MPLEIILVYLKKHFVKEGGESVKIAFWSNVKGKCSTTANAAAMGIMNSLKYGNSFLLFENHIGIDGMDSIFFQKPDNIVDDVSYNYNNMGVDSIIRKINLDTFDVPTIANNVMSFLDNKLFYLPGSRMTSNEIFDYELSRVLPLLMNYLEQFAKNLIIDTAPDNSMSTRAVLELSDIVVVNINQNKSVIDDLFANYSFVVRKALFLVGNYEQYLRFDDMAICRKYGIASDRLAVIPYNYQFKESLYNGTIVDFIEKKYNCKKRDNNYYFITQLKNAAMMLEKRIAENNQ